MKINTLDHDSAATVGPYLQVDTFVSEKNEIMALAKKNGDFAFINIPISAVNDPDVIDSTSAKGSVV
ncbi:hypothetical protein GCM10020331_052380 [Ectobacillus funiculus]